MRRPTTLAATLALSLCLLPAGGCQLIGLGVVGVGNTLHMTAERATTPQVAKRFRVLDGETRARRSPAPGLPSSTTSTGWTAGR